MVPQIYCSVYVNSTFENTLTQTARNLLSDLCIEILSVLFCFLFLSFLPPARSFQFLSFKILFLWALHYLFHMLFTFKNCLS